jgi:adenosylcobinamide kinase / adenosylcobinamide-phosphate guanylyltransferase
VVASLFIVGGARSGKSRFALERARRGERVVFVATAEARDENMARRVARHRAERPSHWTTVEAPVDLVARLQKLEGTAEAFLVDCLTLWVANRLLRGDCDQSILDEADALAGLIGRRRSSFTVVSNEVGGGVHPETSAGLRFRDLLGSVNQRVAAACDTVVLMVAGVPLTVKTPPATARPNDDATLPAS